MEDLKLQPSSPLKEPFPASQSDPRLLHQCFLQLALPAPPPIALMVCKAITELGEENGSSQDSISDYIRANYDDLPWDHKRIPSHYLKWLCDEGLIVLLASDRYSIPGFTPNPALKNPEAPKLVTYVKSRLGQKRRVFFQEQKELVGLEDEHVQNGCEVSIPEIVKIRARKNKRRCDQLLIRWIEEDGSDDDDDDHCYHPMEDEHKLTDRLVVFALATKLPNPTESKRHVTSPFIIDLEDDGNGDDLVNNGASFERLVEEKQEVADKLTDRLIVYALAARLPSQAESRRGFTRRFIQSIEQPKMKIPKYDNPETKSKWPSWIQSLLQTDFYGQCKFHVEKRICDLYCTDCNNGAICTSCVTSHEGHHVIQINQTDCEAAVDVSVIGKHIDISEIQTLKASATKTTIVLKRKIPPWFSKPTNNVCLSCKRRTPYPFKFCALSCKFQHEHKVA